MNKNFFKNPKFYIVLVFFGVLGSIFIFDFSRIARMQIGSAVLFGFLLLTVISWLKSVQKLYELEEAVYYADYVTHFIDSDNMEKLEDIEIYGTVKILRGARKHFSEKENQRIISELKHP